MALHKYSVLVPSICAKPSRVYWNLRRLPPESFFAGVLDDGLGVLGTGLEVMNCGQEGGDGVNGSGNQCSVGLGFLRGISAASRVCDVTSKAAIRLSDFIQEERVIAPRPLSRILLQRFQSLHEAVEVGGGHGVDSVRAFFRVRANCINS